MKTLAKAEADSQWKAHFELYAEEFPRIGLLQGPLLKDGSFHTPQHVAHPLAAFRERPPFQGLYSRVEHDWDVENIEFMRSLARENFILGQRGEGPVVDGLVYLAIDRKLEAEIAFCDARLRFTRFILSQKNERKTRGAKREEPQWTKMPEGTTDEIARQYKNSGYTVRKIETTTQKWYEIQRVK